MPIAPLQRVGVGLVLLGLGTLVAALTLAPWGEGAADEVPPALVEVVRPVAPDPAPLPDERPRAWVRGRVLDGDGHPVVGAVAKVDAGQGVYAASSGAGGAFRVEAPVGHHRLFATRLVGRDEVLGPPMYLDLREEGAAGLDLTLPPDDTVGIGLVLDLQGDAIVVTWAQEGRAAAAAGVRGGDRLVAIDGEPLDRAGLVDVERTLQGAVGSTVMLTLQRGDDSLLALLVHRRPVSEDDVPEE